MSGAEGHAFAFGYIKALIQAVASEVVVDAQNRVAVKPIDERVS